jgi:hypothetical protein
MLLSADRYGSPTPVLAGLGFDPSALVDLATNLVTTGAELAVQERLAYLRRREQEQEAEMLAQAQAAAEARRAEEARMAREEAALRAAAGGGVVPGAPAAGGWPFSAGETVIGLASIGLLAALARRARIL